MFEDCPTRGNYYPTKDGALHLFGSTASTKQSLHRWAAKKERHDVGNSDFEDEDVEESPPEATPPASPTGDFCADFTDDAPQEGPLLRGQSPCRQMRPPRRSESRCYKISRNSLMMKAGKKETRK
eukprot:4338459-Amphidinium_carterae.1